MFQIFELNSSVLTVFWDFISDKASLFKYKTAERILRMMWCLAGWWGCTRELMGKLGLSDIIVEILKQESSNN